MTVIIDDVEKKPEDCWNCNFCAKEDGKYYCTVDDDWIHFEDGSINLDCPVNTLIHCKDCRFFSENWRCLSWHQFSMPEWFCSRAERRLKDERNG